MLHQTEIEPHACEQTMLDPKLEHLQTAASGIAVYLRRLMHMDRSRVEAWLNMSSK